MSASAALTVGSANTCAARRAACASASAASSAAAIASTASRARPGSREAAAYSSSGRWYRQDFGAVAYTVLSFDMPIAWLVDRYWVVASHFVSQLTKRHQQVVRGLVYLHER